jgi:hypothetical protein
LTYLICDKCGRYYELQSDESPGDFVLTCDCGGELKVYNSLDDYTEEFESKVASNDGRSLKSKFLIITIVLFIGLVLAYSWANLNNNSVILGSNSKGSVTKLVYSHPGLSTPKIAIITGMHPREISAKNVVPDVIKSYANTHNIAIVNYKINVTQDPQDFAVGRANGQDLVAQYVIPDIEKSNYSMVIIVHNHEQGYGDGYYIATPSMDGKSVDLAQSVSNLLPDFNYYTRNIAQTPEETSINQIDNPIVATGTPVFVYEIPELLGNSDVTKNSNRLIDAVFSVI